MESFYGDFGIRLRQARNRARLTQETLARRIGLTRTSVSNIESGRQRIPLHTLIQFASALGVKPASLLPRAAPRRAQEADPEQEWVASIIGEPASVGPKKA